MVWMEASSRMNTFGDLMASCWAPPSSPLPPSSCGKGGGYTRGPRSTSPCSRCWPYPILAVGFLEKISLGYIVSLLLAAPIPMLGFLNWPHANLQPMADSRPSPRAATCGYGRPREAIPQNLLAEGRRQASAHHHEVNRNVTRPLQPGDPVPGPRRLPRLQPVGRHGYQRPTAPSFW